MDRSFSSELWSDPRIKRIEPYGKLLFNFLFTNDLSHMSGIYVLPEVLVLSQTGLTQKQLDVQWDALSAEGLAFRDKDTETVFVVSMLKRQCPGGPTERNISAAEKQLKKLHGSPLIPMFLDKYEEWGIKATVKIPQSYPIGAVSRGELTNPAGRDRSLLETSRIYNLESSSPSLSLEVEEPKTEELEVKSLTVESIVDLWNEVAISCELPQVKKITAELRMSIRKVMKELPTLDEWRSLFAEIPLSNLLLGQAEGMSFSASLSWLLDHKKGKAEANYSNVLNGRYRDKNTTNRDFHLQKGIDAANRVMARHGVFPEQQRMLTGVTVDGQEGNAHVLCPPIEVIGGVPSGNEGRAGGDLLRGSGRPASFASHRSDNLGEEEFAAFRDDRGFEDSGRGE